jgi:Na+-transporting NADH:ubiquinone oxidoreductase subunit NqrF
MYKKVKDFHRGVRKIIAKIQMTLQIVLILICVCIHTYFQAKLNSKSSDITIHMSDPNSKSSTILSFGSLTDILRSELPHANI